MRVSWQAVIAAILAWGLVFLLWHPMVDLYLATIQAAQVGEILNQHTKRIENLEKWAQSVSQTVQARNPTQAKTPTSTPTVKSK